MSQTKLNPFLKKNPFLQYERFYSTSSSLTLSTSSSTTSLETSLPANPPKNYIPDSDRKLPNPFSKGSSKNLMKGGKYDNIKKRKLVNPFHRKNLLYSQNLTDVQHFEEIKDVPETYYICEPSPQKPIIFQQKKKNLDIGKIIVNMVGSPSAAQETQKVGSYSNFISPRFAQGRTLKDIISSRTNSIEQKMNRVEQIDNFESEVRFRNKTFHRKIIFSKRF